MHHKDRIESEYQTPIPPPRGPLTAAELVEREARKAARVEALRRAQLKREAEERERAASVEAWRLRRETLEEMESYDDEKLREEFTCMAADAALKRLVDHEIFVEAIDALVRSAPYLSEWTPSARVALAWHHVDGMPGRAPVQDAGGVWIGSLVDYCLVRWSARWQDAKDPRRGNWRTFTDAVNREIERGVGRRIGVEDIYTRLANTYDEPHIALAVVAVFEKIPTFLLGPEEMKIVREMTPSRVDPKPAELPAGRVVSLASRRKEG